MILKQKNKKIILVANSSWYLYNFRVQLLNELVKEGFEVILIAPKDKFTNHLKELGFGFYNWNLKGLSINPFRELKSFLELLKLYTNLKPDLVHHFTIKSCIYGTLSAKFAGIKIVVNAITGLGYVFLSKTQKALILRTLLKPLYRLIFKARRSTVIFQNKHDLGKLTKLGIVKPENSSLISSSGIDINYFRSTKNTTVLNKNINNLLFPSRVLTEKGFKELLQASKLLWLKGLKFNLYLVGEIDELNNKFIQKNYREELEEIKCLKILGKVNNMKEIYLKSDLVVLPSWREGLSKALIEAASMELPIITTDVAGCNDVIDHGINGMLVPVRDSHALSLAIEFLILNPDIAEKFGRLAREKVKNNFEINLINNDTIKLYENLFLEKKID